MSHRESIETISGCRTRFMRKGSGEPLLFLHGAAGAGAWLPFMEELSQKYDVIVPEHPGFGGSDTPEWLDNIGDLAYFYLDVIDHLGLSDVHLVGTSLGGWIAAELATRDCSAIKTMTLVAPAGVNVRGVPRGDIFMWSPEETTKKLFHNQEIAAAVPQPANDEEMQLVLKNRLMVAKLGWSPRMHNPDLKKWLHRISVPTLIIWGDDDQVLPSAYGSAYRDLIPNSELDIISECGHLPHVEKANEFTAKVTGFIEGAA